MSGIGVFVLNICGLLGFGKCFVNFDNCELCFDVNCDIESVV